MHKAIECGLWHLHCLWPQEKKHVFWCVFAAAARVANLQACFAKPCHLDTRQPPTPILHTPSPRRHTAQPNLTSHNGSRCTDPLPARCRPHNQARSSRCRQGVCQQPRGQVGLVTEDAIICLSVPLCSPWRAQLPPHAGHPRPRSLCLPPSCQQTSPNSARR